MRRSLLLCAALLLAPALVQAHGQFHRRIEALNARILAEPQAAEPLIQRALAYRDHGDRERAQEDLAAAARIDPDFPQLDYFRAILLLDAGQPGEAEPVLRRQLSRTPEDPRARLALAHALARSDRPAEAAAEFERLTDREPPPAPEIFLEHADALAKADPANGSQAIALLDRAIARLGPVPALVERALELELAQGDTEAALRRIDGQIRTARHPEGWQRRRQELLASPLGK